MLRVHEGLTFSEFDTPPLYQGLGIDLTPDSVKQALTNVGVTEQNISAAIGAGIAGVVLIVGSSLLPSEFKWTPYLRLAGIVAGASLAIGGAAYAFKKPDAGTVPGASNLFTAPEIVLAAEQGWKILGTPRIDLTITNKTGSPLGLQIDARDFLGTAPTDTGLEMTWNPESLDVPANGSASKSFYFVTDKIKNAPGPRTVVFTVRDRTNGKVYAVWSQTVNFS
jgi:hypothetical protein